MLSWRQAIEEMNRAFSSGGPRDSLREVHSRPLVGIELMDRLAELGLLTPLCAKIEDVEKCTEGHDRDVWTWAIRVSAINVRIQLIE
jgi:hypothetical protein